MRGVSYWGVFECGVKNFANWGPFVATASLSALDVFRKGLVAQVNRAEQARQARAGHKKEPVSGSVHREYSARFG